MKRKLNRLMQISIIFLLILACCACQKNQSALNNKKLAKALEVSITPPIEIETESGSKLPTITPPADKSDYSAEINKNAIIKDTAIYNCDIDKDKKAFQNDSIDTVVGDKYYATQINDWYANFSEYEGQTVEIEGYYIDYAPYTFIGRLGPACQYCQGGYVCFEFVTNEELSKFKSESDWIKIKGILRKGDDSSAGEFYYIEALSIEKMDEVGKATVTN